MVDVVVRGTEDLLRLSKALKEAGHGGRGGLRADLSKGVRAAVRPAQVKAGEALDAALPSGLRGQGRRVKQTTRIRTGSDPGVTTGLAYGKKNRGSIGASNARLINQRGVLRHPVFGNRQRWATTRTGGLGWFDRSMRSSAPQARASIQAAMQDTANTVVRRAKASG